MISYSSLIGLEILTVAFHGLSKGRALVVRLPSRWRTIMISALQVHFISFFAVSFLLGVFTLLLGILTFLAVSWPRTRGKHSYWGLGVAVLLYVICVAHFAMAIRQDFGTFTGGAQTDVRRYALWGISMISLDYIACIIADMLLVWRLWVVYDKNVKVAIIPALLVLGTAITSIGYIDTGFRVFRNAKDLTMPDVWRLGYTNPIRAWSVPRLVLSTTTNVVLTVVIAIKFIRHHRTMRAMTGSTTLLFESIVMIESGAIYALAWIVRFVVYMINHPSIVIIADTIGQLAGIVPTLIIVTIMAGFSPITRPDYSSRFPHFATATTKDTSVIMDTQLSIPFETDHTGATSSLELNFAGLGGEHTHGLEVNEKNASLQLQNDASVASRV
ncbi:hypothetical protein HGRIS_012188 [Hohenbuehelia grisea]|uniref:Uncharacterized protein n=1 Tax=Hohenbuehelia grisea TaxID=104357 RepID=A0ABR3IRH7_9AGAR